MPDSVSASNKAPVAEIKDSITGKSWGSSTFLTYDDKPVMSHELSHVILGVLGLWENIFELGIASLSSAGHEAISSANAIVEAGADPEFIRDSDKYYLYIANKLRLFYELDSIDPNGSQIQHQEFQRGVNRDGKYVISADRIQDMLNLARGKAGYYELF